jgi:predicted AAA+ superfamily ATPase
MDVELDYALNTFLEVLKLIGAGEAEQQDYILKWIAHLIQKPFDLPGVALVISGLKGCGKDTLFDFLQQFVIGMDYSFNYGSNEQFFDSHDTGRQSKFLCKLEEANRSICLRNADKLK